MGSSVQRAVVSVPGVKPSSLNESLYYPPSPIAVDCDHITNAAKAVARVNREFLHLTSRLAKAQPLALRHALKVEWSQDDLNFFAALTPSQIDLVSPVVSLLYLVRPAAIRRQLASTFKPDDPHPSSTTLPNTMVVAANAATQYLSTLNREFLHLLRELTRIDPPSMRCATGINFDLSDASLFSGLSIADIDSIAFGLVPVVLVRPRDIQTYFADQDPITLGESINVQQRKSLR